jgi:hypothetical protein
VWEQHCKIVDIQIHLTCVLSLTTRIVIPFFFSGSVGYVCLGVYMYEIHRLLHRYIIYVEKVPICSH